MSISQNITQKVLSTYAQKKSKDRTLGCHLVTCDNFGKNCAKLVVGTGGNLDKNTVRQFIFSCTDHKLIPFTDSMKFYEDGRNGYNYASVIAYKPSIHYKDADKVSGMTQINSNSFLDEELGSVWEKRDLNGKQYFVRSNDDDVEEILREAYLNSSSATVRASANINEFNHRVSPGDYIEFFTFKKDTPGKSLGYVTSSAEDSVKVRTTKGKEFDIPVHAILSKVPGEEVNSVEEVIDFLKDAYATEDNVEYRKQLDKMKENL